MKESVMRTTVLLSMLLLTTACGVVEQKKDAALRTLGKATLNGVFRLASAEGTTPSESAGRFTEAVVSEASSSPAPAQNVAPAPVSLARADEAVSPVIPVPSVSLGTPAEGSFEFAYSRAKVAVAAHAERPLHIADFEVHFAEQLDTVRMIPSAPPAPAVPEKECSTQLRTAS